MAFTNNDLDAEKAHKARANTSQQRPFLKTQVDSLEVVDLSGAPTNDKNQKKQMSEVQLNLVKTNAVSNRDRIMKHGSNQRNVAVSNKVLMNGNNYEGMNTTKNPNLLIKALKESVNPLTQNLIKNLDSMKKSSEKSSLSKNQSKTPTHALAAHVKPQMMKAVPPTVTKVPFVNQQNRSVGSSQISNPAKQLGARSEKLMSINPSGVINTPTSSVGSNLNVGKKQPTLPQQGHFSVTKNIIESKQQIAQVPLTAVSTSEPLRSSTILTHPKRRSGEIITPVSVLSNKRKFPSFKAEFDPTVASFIKLDPVPHTYTLPKLNAVELGNLEKMLQFRAFYHNNVICSWKDDWGGNLQFIDKEIITNRDKIFHNPSTKPTTISFIKSVASRARDGRAENFLGVKLLFSFVYHLKDTPPMARRILAYALHRHVDSVSERSNLINDCIRRISHDPIVLQEDGWTTIRSKEPIGASGGAFLIGRRVIWSRYEAIVIAFVKDDDMGDLWKAMWIEDLETFDLEADEMQDAIKKYESKEARKKARISKNKANSDGNNVNTSTNYSTIGSKITKPSTSTRFSATTNFTVEGIEQGIVLASTYHENARMGVFWPARVIHVSELNELGGSGFTSRRSSQKNNIPVVFLAPYWNGISTRSSKSNDFESVKNIYSTGPLFELDNVEVSSSTIQKYPEDGNPDSFSIDKLRDSFRFLGLPKAVFGRFLDSHRLALGLRHYARNHLAGSNHDVIASAALTETHALSIKTAMFPKVVLNLPYSYIISKLPTLDQQASQITKNDTDDDFEPILQLASIAKSMIPPFCWRKNMGDQNAMQRTPILQNPSLIATPLTKQPLTPVTSPETRTSMGTSGDSSSGSKITNGVEWSPSDFASAYLLNFIGDGNRDDVLISSLGIQLSDLVRRLSRYRHIVFERNTAETKRILNSFSCHVLLVKGHGEDVLYSQNFDNSLNIENMVTEWRKACEKIFKCARIKLSREGFGNGVTTVITDSRCNHHLTASGSFERAVRLPAAIKGAKNVGAGSQKNVPLITKVEDVYMDIAEKKIIPRAHKSSYLKRLKSRIADLPNDAKGEPITDDSEGEGGEDTRGSRGSYTAAVAAVAAALHSVDLVIKGDCVNAFCAVRPPGHHAGKELRSMNAVSNGFCLLNGAACAALYATMPQAEGGCGLKRVCVIDFDVHHGNGTQDILCSTYDSRFLYISIHAGGAHINGYESDGNDDGAKGFRRPFYMGSKQPEGIFPGRCGDTSPHPGVLNIPLGQKVTAHGIGNALVSKVSPAVRKFSPELIILSAGFDAHKNDPLGMGGLNAEDFGSVTDVACQMAAKCCSGRVVSLLEGGYGVPCCRPRKNIFLPTPVPQTNYRTLDLGDCLPPSMTDNIDDNLVQVLDKCHSEGFLQCIQEHVGALIRCSKLSFAKNPRES